MQISDAKLIKKTVKIGDEIKMKLEVPESYGRMAAQTAKQVIIQRLREAERDMIFNDFKDKEHEVVSGVVQRREGRFVLVDLGKSVGVLPTDEQIPGEYYNAGDRIKVYVKEVASRAKGPEIILSRISDEILKKVFYLEIPEISNGLIEIKAVAREAGSRSKVAVFTDSDNVDPIGSCVGQRGARIQTIIKELGGEKVDIIEYNEDPNKFIGNALSPAKIISINLDENEKKAMVTVASDQLSLAIGKGGQNARLAARLTGWKIDIIESQEGKKVVAKVEADEIITTEENQEKPAEIEGASAEETSQDKPADVEVSEQSAE
jgi:transcription termination/antitermination protein NusA